MKKLIIIIAAVVSVAFGSEGASRLKVTLSDGTAPTFVLADKPVVTFPGMDVVFTTSEATVEFARSKVVNMEFEDVATVVDTVGDQVDFRYIGGIISAAGRIVVYTLDGRLCLEGYDSLSTSDLPAGGYVVRTTSHTVKILK